MSSDAQVSTEDLAGTGAVPRRERDAQESGASEQIGATSTPGAEASPVRTAGESHENVATTAESPGRDDRHGGDETAAGRMSAPDDPTDVALLDSADQESFRQRWSDVQARFVDDPQGAVQTADGLVAELMQSLARGFSDHKSRLESHWQSGETPGTEDLRQALQRYRSFFDRLLAT
jgi:hypothetical protein